MRLRWRFRSPCVRCFSVNHVTRERVKGAIAAPLTIPAPGKKIGASLRLAPAFRKRFGDFQPDQGAAVCLL